MGIEQDIDDFIDEMEQNNEEVNEQAIKELLSQGYMYCRSYGNVEQTLIGTNYKILDFVEVGSKKLVFVVVK